MTGKNILIAILVLVIFGLGIYLLFDGSGNRIVQEQDYSFETNSNNEQKSERDSQKNNTVKDRDQNQTQDESREDLIQVSFPQKNDTVGSPLIVTGIAKGNWYFEGDFSVRLLDSQGNEIASAPAQAQGEWMTEDFVPFMAELNFNPNGMEEGRLVLEKSNPSGLQENENSIEIPVRIDSTKTTVKAYFNNSNLAQDVCDNVVPVARSIDRTSAIARATLEELFEGLTEKEKELDYATSINQGIQIQELEITDGIARVDLSEELDEGVAGSCRVNAIRAQIEQTLMQFPTVDSVEISVDGRTEDVLQP